VKGDFGKAFSGVDEEHKNFPVAVKFFALNKFKDTSKAILDFTLESVSHDTTTVFEILFQLLMYNTGTETFILLLMIRCRERHDNIGKVSVPVL